MVLHFNYSGSDRSLETLRNGLTEMLITHLAAIPEIRVFERQRLDDLLYEQRLSHSKAFDGSTAARLGKLVGARFLVLGSYMQLNDRLRIDARVVEVETGEIVRTAKALGSPHDLAGLEGQLVEQIGNGLGKILPLTLPHVAPAANVSAKDVAMLGSVMIDQNEGRVEDARAKLKALLQKSPGIKPSIANGSALLKLAE